MSLSDFLGKHWRRCLGIWWPQVAAAVAAVFLLHRLTNCSHCLLGVITDPRAANFCNNSEQDGSLMYVTSELYVALIVAAGVIFISNLMFLWEIPVQAVKQAAIAFSQTPKMSPYHAFAFILTVLNLLITLAWAFKLIVGAHAWIGDEQTALILFTVFCVIDGLFLRSTVVAFEAAAEHYRRASRQKTKLREELHSLELTRRLFHDSLWYVDAPVVLGVTIVLLFSHFSEIHFNTLGRITPAAFNAYGSGFTVEHLRAVFSLFVAGISAGATVTHLVVSQFIFGVIRTRDLYRRHVPSNIV
jgi:hypothetical protein